MNTIPTYAQISRKARSHLKNLGARKVTLAHCKYLELTYIRCSHAKCSSYGDLSPWICAPVLCADFALNACGNSRISNMAIEI